MLKSLLVAPVGLMFPATAALDRQSTYRVHVPDWNSQANQT